MRHTLRAVFSDPGAARQALDALRAAGYPDGDATLATVPAPAQAGPMEEPMPPAAARASSAAGHLLARLLGHEAASTRSEPSPCTLTLETDSEADASRAAVLVPALHRVDSGAPAPRVSDGAPATAHASYRPGTAPGTLQFYARENSHYFGTHEAGDIRPGGTTFNEPMLPAGHWPAMERAGSASAGGVPGLPGDDGAASAAYRFGRDLHNNDSYRNRSWDEADADLEVLWNARGPQAGTWEESKAAVRLGWNSTSPEIDEDRYHRSHWKTSYLRRPGNGGATAAQSLFARAPGDDPRSVWKRRHPGELPPWERFVDAVRSGWARTAARMDQDEADYRRHHAASFPGTAYQELAPVYRYGRHVRDRAAFHGRSWDEVESELRAEWESGCREGNTSPWETIRSAVREGWEHGAS